MYSKYTDLTAAAFPEQQRCMTQKYRELLDRHPLQSSSKNRNISYLSREEHYIASTSHPALWTSKTNCALPMVVSVVFRGKLFTGVASLKGPSSNLKFENSGALTGFLGSTLLLAVYFVNAERPTYCRVHRQPDGLQHLSVPFLQIGCGISANSSTKRSCMGDLRTKYSRSKYPLM